MEDVPPWVPADPRGPCETWCGVCGDPDPESFFNLNLKAVKTRRAFNIPLDQIIDERVKVCTRHRDRGDPLKRADQPKFFPPVVSALRWQMCPR